MAVSSPLEARAHVRGGSIAVELDRVAVRVFDVDGRVPTTTADLDAGALHPLADLPPLGARKAEAEVVEATGGGVERPAALDEVQEVAAPGGLEEDHPLVREGGLEPKDVEIEPLGAPAVPGPEREVAQPAVHPVPSYDAGDGAAGIIHQLAGGHPRRPAPGRRASRGPSGPRNPGRSARPPPRRRRRGPRRSESAIP